MAAMNRLVAPEHHLSADFSPPPDNRPDAGVYSFNRQQLDIITKGIAEGAEQKARQRSLRARIRRGIARARWPLHKLSRPREFIRIVRQRLAHRIRLRWPDHRLGKARDESE